MHHLKKINLKIPKIDHFIHKCYIESAREMWKNPYLFNENVPGHEYQRNSKEIELIIKLSIENTIRNLLPIRETNQKEFEKLEKHHLNFIWENLMISKEILEAHKPRVIVVTPIARKFSIEGVSSGSPCE